MPPCPNVIAWCTLPPTPNSSHSNYGTSSNCGLKFSLFLSFLNFENLIWNKIILNLKEFCVSVRIKMKKSQMTELVLPCPRFTRNLSSRCADRILCPSRVPTLTVHWSANGLGDIGWHCPLLRVIHWTKMSTDQAGQLLDNQSFSF